MNNTMIVKVLWYSIFFIHKLYIYTSIFILYYHLITITTTQIAYLKVLNHKYTHVEFPNSLWSFGIPILHTGVTNC